MEAARQEPEKPVYVEIRKAYLNLSLPMTTKKDYRQSQKYNELFFKEISRNNRTIGAGFRLKKNYQNWKFLHVKRRGNAA
ncbi:MAG: hypothetical protein LUQ11_03140 [Methylococcaceae bacterium]|nr:hypothetical protein [Methylococcaceae bacterium]